uniref:CUB domain-containing protein n=1 Tax=Timema monikensis TaxID=170555 RepID=A0A7R9ED79_9NEOP|nr:unnamed protein product [Timema monikensis]
MVEIFRCDYSKEYNSEEDLHIISDYGIASVLPAAYIAEKNRAVERAWVPEESPQLADGKTSCLSIQWVPEQHSSGLYWHPQSCSMVGGYVCKRSSQVSVNDLNLNQTMNGTEGNLTSPNYPGQYYNNLDYNVSVSGPHLTRIVIQFSRLDLEPQLDCLYDYVELRNPGSSRGARWCGSYHNDMQRFTMSTIESTSLPPNMSTIGTHESYGHRLLTEVSQEHTQFIAKRRHSTRTV